MRETQRKRDVPEMALSDSLQDLQIIEGREFGESQPRGQLSAHSVREVLSRVQDSLRSAGCSVEQGVDALKNVQQMFESGEVHLLLSECCNNEGIGVEKTYLDLVSSLTQFAALPLCEADSGDLPARSYADIPDRACAVCAVLLTLLRRLGTGKEAPHCSSPASPASQLARALAPLLCVFAVTHLEDQPWTSEASRMAASELLDTIVQGGSFVSVTHLLCGEAPGDEAGCLGAILEILKPELKKETWKRNQSTKHVFAWILIHVGRPWLAEFLDRVFPPSLLMSDDYRTENKVLGVCCLHHIILNVPAADLRQYNRAQVLYHALFNHLYTSEAQLIEVVLPCLLDLLSVLEKPPGSTVTPRKPNRCDEVMRLVLTHMEMEHKLALRRVYAHNLTLFIDSRMGIVTVRHLKRLERVIVGYMEVSDAPGEQARLSILDALERTLKLAWPRVECRLAVLARALLKLLVDVSMDRTPLSAGVRAELLDKATRCLMLLNHCTQGKLKVLLMELDSSCTDHAVLECIKKVIDTS
ncbi:hypothetical protein MATL_G00060060 [Megalops atlanticus]|uniref:TELO2-interacting protein 2 n=1 Tax=Megalops atlanticus TaxID=7932 RepID=A0A9D3T990_MEGAT|nr:hypothetical protein MATL_G00060060 [Megalops atlanticus]